MKYSELSGKVAIVTGGGAGIGRATAIAFAQEGVNVVVADWNEQNGEETVRQIESIASTQSNGKSVFVQIDVSNALDAQKLVNTTIEKFGRLDILHNNAGIQTYGTVVSTDEDVWDRTLNVNLKSIYLVSKFAIPHMINAGGGSIINTASIQSHACLPNSAAYVASKGGVLALTREMALDFAKNNIRVNAILPGSIQTPMLEFAASQEAEPDKNKVFQEWGKNYPLGRIGTPEEVAGLVVFLASNSATFISGAPFLVDGGLAAKLF